MARAVWQAQLRCACTGSVTETLYNELRRQCCAARLACGSAQCVSIKCGQWWYHVCLLGLHYVGPCVVACVCSCVRVCVHATCVCLCVCVRMRWAGAWLHFCWSQASLRLCNAVQPCAPALCCAARRKGCARGQGLHAFHAVRCHV